MPLYLSLSGCAIAVGSSLMVGRLFQRRDPVMTDMLGMMIGMTLGMLTGLSVGAWLGLATDMFISNTLGVAIGLAFGVGFGRLGGWMGILDGGLGGVMGGMMGAMLGVMIRISPTAIWVTAGLMGVVHLGGLGALIRLKRELQTGATAIDPVCGMTVNRAHAPAQSTHRGQTVYFCAPGCKRAFDRDPALFLDAARVEPIAAPSGGRSR